MGILKGRRNRVRERRLSLNLSQKKLSEITGVSILTIIKIENGTTNPNLDVIKEIAKALSSTLEELFGDRYNNK